jgi:hypothetical protein
MMFAWPESQMRSDSKCGNKVVGSLEGESSAGAEADFEEGSSGGGL